MIHMTYSVRSNHLVSYSSTQMIITPPIHCDLHRLPRTMANKVLLLYGSGPNVGAGILKKFAANGWKTAAVVRTMKDEYKNSAELVLQADFADAQAIQKVYSEVESKLGTPNCVVYNGVYISCTDSRRVLFLKVS